MAGDDPDREERDHQLEEARRKRLVDAVRKGEVLRQRLEETCRVARTSTFHWHAPTRQLEADDSLPGLFGVAAAADDFDRLAEHVHPDDAVAMRERWLRCTEHAAPFAIDLRVLGADAHRVVRWLRLSARSFTCERERPCVVGACADVTDLHRSRRAATMAQVADGIPHQVWIARADGGIEWLNDRWSELQLGASRSDPTVALISSFHPDDQPRLRERWLRATRHGEVLEVEARLLRRSGEPRWFLVRAVPIADPDGVIHRWVGTCTDIDQQKHAEIHALVACAEREKAMATVGHELRGPLMSLSSALELVQLRAPEIDRVRALMERQVGRITRLADDLTEATRAGIGRVEVRPRRIDVAETIAEAVESCDPLLRERRHTLVVKVDESLHVHGDPDRLHQVFTNLLTNAARYTPRGGHLCVRALRRNGDVIVEVGDDGMGISAELLTRMFEPFVQGPRTAEGTTGLGLGLAIARSLVELHHGAIEAESPGPGLGSTFRVRLPAADAPIPRATTTRAARARRVLVVDDNPDVTEVVRELLHTEGHQVMVAHDTRGAIELATTASPDVALIDVNLGEHDGADLARALRERLGERCPTLIAMTGHSDLPADRRAAFDRVLVKPLERHLLLSSVARHRRRRRRSVTGPRRSGRSRRARPGRRARSRSAGRPAPRTRR